MSKEWMLISNGKIPADVPPMQMIEITLSDYRRLKILARFAKSINGNILAYREAIGQITKPITFAL